MLHKILVNFAHHLIGWGEPWVDEGVEDGLEVLHDEDDVAGATALGGAVAVEEHLEVELLLHFERQSSSGTEKNPE